MKFYVALSCLLFAIGCGTNSNKFVDEETLKYVESLNDRNASNLNKFFEYKKIAEHHNRNKKSF
jgi:hypothetical protein